MVHQLPADEQAAIVKAFQNPETAQSNGVRAAGQKFFCIGANDRSVYGKKQVSEPL
jgi:profilin